MFGTYFSSHKTKSRLKASYKCFSCDLPPGHQINFKSDGVTIYNKFIAVDLYELKRCKVADVYVDLDGIWSTRSNEVLVKKIIINGEAGGGKTWLCKYIAHRWANDHLWNDRFDYIFYLPLQGIQSISTQPDWQSQYRNLPNALNSHILSCYFHHTHKEAGCDIAKLIAIDTHKRSRVLLLIDGYNTTLSQQYTSTTASDASPLLTKILNQALEYPHYILFARPDSVFKHETIKATDLLLHHETNYTAGYMKQYYSRYILQDSFTHNKGERNSGAQLTAAVLELETRERYNTLGKLLFQSVVVQTYCEYPVFFFLLCFVWRGVDRETRDAFLVEDITVFSLNAFVVDYLTSEELSQLHQQQQKMQKINNTTIKNPLNVDSKDVEAGSSTGTTDATHATNSVDKFLESIHRAVDTTIEHIVACMPMIAETRYLSVVIRQYLTAQHLLFILQHSPAESAEVQSVVLFIRSHWHNSEYLILFQCLAGMIAAGTVSATSASVGSTNYPINEKGKDNRDTVSDVNTIFWDAIIPSTLTADTIGVDSTILSLPLNQIAVVCHLLSQCVSGGVVSSCVLLRIVNSVNEYLLSNIATISAATTAAEGAAASASAAVDMLLTTRYLPDIIATYCLKQISPALATDSTVVSDISISAGGDGTAGSISSGTLTNNHIYLKLLSCKQKSVIDLDFFICDTVHSILHDITTETPTDNTNTSVSISINCESNENNTADRYKSVDIILKILSNLSSDSDYRVSTALQILIASPATPQSTVTMCIEMLSRLHWTLNELTIAVFNNLLVHPDSSMDVITHTVNALNYLLNDVVELSNTASHSTNNKHISKSNKVQPQSLTNIIIDNMLHALTASSVMSHKSPQSQIELVKSVVRLLSQFQVPIDTIVEKNILVLTKHQALITFTGELHSTYLHSIDVLRLLTLGSNNSSNCNNRNSSNNIQHGKPLITPAQLAVIHKSLVTKLNLIETKRYTVLQNNDNVQTICKIIPLLCSSSSEKSQLVTQLIGYLKHCNVSVQITASKALLSFASTQPNSVYYSAHSLTQSVFTTDHKNTIFSHISATAASSPATRCVAVTLSRILLTLCQYSSEEINRIFEKILKINSYAIFLRVNVVHIIATQYPKYLTAAMVNSMLEIYGNTIFHNNWTLTMHSTMIAIITSKTEYFLFENWVVATMSRHSQHCRTVELLEIVAEKFPELVSPRIIDCVVKCIVTHSKPLERAIISCVERIICNQQIDNDILSHLWMTFDSDIWVKILLNSTVENNILDFLLTHRANTVTLEVFRMFVAQLLTHRHSNELCATFLKKIVSVLPEYACTELVRIVTDFPVLATDAVSLQLPTACVFIAIVAECQPDLITTAIFEQLLQLSNSFMYYPSHLEVLTIAIVKIFHIAHIQTIVTTDHCLQLASMQFDSLSKPLIVKALVYLMDSLPELLSFDTLAELYLRQSKVYLFESITTITQQYPQYLTAQLVDKIFTLMETCQISAKQAVEVFIVTLLEHRSDLCNREYFNICLKENKKQYAAMVLLNVILNRNDHKNLDLNNHSGDQMEENGIVDFTPNSNTTLSVYVNIKVVETIYNISTTTHVFQTGLFAILRSTLVRLLCALPVCSELREIVHKVVVHTTCANNNNSTTITTKTNNTWSSNSHVNNYVNSGLELRDIGTLAAAYPAEVCVDGVMSYVTSKLTIHDHSAAVVKEAVVAYECLIIHLYKLAQKTRDECKINNSIHNSNYSSDEDIANTTIVTDNDHLTDKLVPLLSHNYTTDVKGGAITSTSDVSILQTTILSVHRIVAAFPQCFTVEICDALMAILLNKHISSREKTTTATIESIYQTLHTALVPSNGSGDSGDISTVFSQRNLSYLDIHTLMHLFENSDSSASASVVVVYGQLLLLLVKNTLQNNIVSGSDVGGWQSHLVALFHIALKHYMTHSGNMFHTVDADRLFALLFDILQFFATLLDNSSSGNVSENSNNSNNEIISNEIIISKEFIHSKLTDLLTNYLVEEQHKKTWKIITEIVNKCPVFVDSWLVCTLFAQLTSGSERQDRLQSLASTISYTVISTILTTYPESTTIKLITLPLLLTAISSKVYNIKFHGAQLLQQYVEKFSHVLSIPEVENIIPLLLDVHKEPQIIFEKVITFCVSHRSDLITSSFLLSKLRDNDKDLKVIEQYAKLITVTVHTNKDAISRDIVTTLFESLTSTKQPVTWHASCFEAVFESLAHCILLRSDLDFSINVLLDIVWKGTASSGDTVINPRTMKCFCMAVQLCCQHQPHSVTQRMVDVVVHMLNENVSYSVNAATVCMSITTFCPQFISFALIDGLLMWAYDCSVVCGTTNLVKSYTALEVLTYLCSNKVEKSEIYKQYVLSHEALNCMVLRTIIDYEIV